LIFNYLCNQCLSPLKLWVQVSLRRGVLDTTLCDKVCQWLVAGRWFSTGTQVSSTNKTDRHDITEILLKVALNTVALTLYWGITDGECKWMSNRKRREKCVPALTSWPIAREISFMTAVPPDGSIAPNTQASLWLPTKTYLSEKESLLSVNT
jgi:hypothetical protein